MKRDELIGALRRLKVETGSLACLGCGREHNCSTQGCAILREAVEELERDPWISVAERLPEIQEGQYVSRDVFVTDGESITATRLRRRYNMTCYFPNVFLFPVTHWCELSDLLPKSAPREEDDNGGHQPDR